MEAAVWPGTLSATRSFAMHGDALYGDGWMKLPTGDADVRACAGLTEGTRGRLYFKAPYLRPAAVNAVVWRLDRDGVVFRLTGPHIAPPPLEIVPQNCQFRLSGSLIWTW